MPRPIECNMENAPANVNEQLQIFLGYMVHLAGGKVNLPPVKEMADFLLDNFALKKDTQPDNTVVITLIPIGGADARAN